MIQRSNRDQFTLVGAVGGRVGKGGWVGRWLGEWGNGRRAGWVGGRVGERVGRRVGKDKVGRASKGDGKGGQYLSLWQQGAAHSLGLAKPAQLRVCTLLGTDTTTGPGRLLYTGGYKCMFAA
jgi:hypothetical protein